MILDPRKRPRLDVLEDLEHLVEHDRSLDVAADRLGISRDYAVHLLTHAADIRAAAAPTDG